jgi:maltokinase
VRLPGDLEESIAVWLPRQRWFAGKGRDIDKLAILTDTELVQADPGLHHVIVAVHQDDSVDRYQLLVGVRTELPERLVHAEIEHGTGIDQGVRAYEAVHDPELTPALLDLLAAGEDFGPLSFHTVPDVQLETGLVGVVSTAEQSNTSLIFGAAPGPTYIYKVFRRIAPGPNPDLELNLGLARVGCSHVPKLYGWISDDSGSTLAMVSEFLATAVDGWRLATASVRDLLNPVGLTPAAPGAGPEPTPPTPEEAGGDFAAEAERLGAATAAVHRDLAAAFGVGELSREGVRELTAGMHRQLEEAVEAVPQMARFAPAIANAFDELAAQGTGLPVQSVHGDYHLGQVLRSGTGWVVLDFEGEPGRTAAERRISSHPLRDVAGMLRSFDYAALYLLHGDPGLREALPGASPEHFELLENRALEWAAHNRAAFCRGYATAGGPDPAAHGVLLRALEYDKAVYEALYEARNRPSWLEIPLRSLARELYR